MSDTANPVGTAPHGTGGCPFSVGELLPFETRVSSIKSSGSSHQTWLLFATRMGSFEQDGEGTTPRFSASALVLDMLTRGDATRTVVSAGGQV